MVKVRTDFQCRRSWPLPALPGSVPLDEEVSVRRLLPDDPAVRERMRLRFGARTSATIDLSVEVGRDCVGAAQLHDPDVEATSPSGRGSSSARPVTLQSTLHYSAAARFRVDRSGDGPYRTAVDDRKAARRRRAPGSSARRPGRLGELVRGSAARARGTASRSREIARQHQSGSAPSFSTSR